jgi:hypothetical protein
MHASMNKWINSITDARRYVMLSASEKYSIKVRFGKK